MQTALGAMMTSAAARWGQRTGVDGVTRGHDLVIPVPQTLAVELGAIPGEAVRVGLVQDVEDDVGADPRVLRYVRHDLLPHLRTKGTSVGQPCLEAHLMT